MNKIVSRAKQLLAVFTAATAICDATLDASYDIDDSKTELPPLYIEFSDNTSHHVVQKLILIARTSATLMPSIKEHTDTIIESLGIIEREYDRLSELESEDEVYESVVDAIDNMFTNICDNYDSSCFDINDLEDWKNVYLIHFSNFTVYLFEYLFSESGNRGENSGFNYNLARHDVIELLKIAIAASSSEGTK